MEAHCHLALRIGRPARPGEIVFSGGDLDGRFKTLFDSLAMPKDTQAVDAKDVTQAEYICLLSDDELITGLSVESYRLLEPSKQNENYIDIDIAVTITAMTPMYGTTDLLFG
jgi:hypothetical protein